MQTPVERFGIETQLREAEEQLETAISTLESIAPLGQTVGPDGSIPAPANHEVHDYSDRLRGLRDALEPLLYEETRLSVIKVRSTLDRMHAELDDLVQREVDFAQVGFEHSSGQKDMPTIGKTGLHVINAREAIDRACQALPKTAR